MTSGQKKSQARTSNNRRNELYSFQKTVITALTWSSGYDPPAIYDPADWGSNPQIMKKILTQRRRILGNLSLPPKELAVRAAVEVLPFPTLLHI